MSRLMSVVWIVQFWAFLALSFACLFRPQVMTYLLEGCVTVQAAPLCCPVVDSDGTAEPGTDHLIPHGFGRAEAAGCPDGVTPRAVDPTRVPGPPEPCGPAPCVQCVDPLSGGPACVIVERDIEAQGLFSLVRLLSPFFLALSMFSLHAMTRTDERTRRNLAFIFAAMFTVIAVLVYTDDFGDVFGPDAARTHVFENRALVAALLALLLFSLYSIVRAEDGSRRAAAALAAAGYGGLLVPYAFTAGSVGHPALLGSITLGDSSYPTHHVLAAIGAFVLAADTVAGDLERSRARLFAVVLVFPLVLFAMDLASPENGTGALADEPLVVRAILALAVVDIVLHAQYAAWPIEDAEQKLSGSASTRPPSLWVLWLFQGLAFFAFAGLLVWSHRPGRAAAQEGLFVGEAIMRRLAEDGSYTEMFGDIDEIYPGLLVALGLFSLSGMQASREWVWKVHCVIFALFYGAQSLCLVFVWNQAAFSHRLMVLLVPSIALFVAHALYYRSHQRWFSEDVGEGPDGWVSNDLLLGPPLLVKSVLTRRRASHAAGVAATGRMVVSGSAAMPPHELLRPGATMDVHVRFANERSADDAAADARGAALGLVAADGTRFDLTLSTGAFGAARNIVEFTLIQVLSALGRPGLSLLARSRRFLEGGLAALRRAPGSYVHLSYHSQTVRLWVSSDRNERWLVRYRLSPEDLSAEESCADVTIHDYVHRGRARGERRPVDYLRRELKMRLQGTRTVQLKLQAQFHSVATGDGLAWYDPTSDWHAGEYPWVDVGEITLTSVLSDEACEKLTFNTDNAPSSLGIPVSQSILDPRSIADSERRVMRRVQALRVWLIAVLGLPRTPQRPVT